jgi:hypothetical protein
MALPIPTNTTADLYRSPNAPPAAPTIAALPGGLQGRGRNIKTNIIYTHSFDLALGTDVRFSMTDTLYIPDKNGTAFTVMFTERIRFGFGNDFIRVYLNRKAAPWPTNNL